MPTGRLRVLLVLAGLLVVLAAGAALAAHALLSRPGDVVHPDVPFTDPATTTATTPAPQPPKRRAEPLVTWPRYGYSRDHTRFFRPPRPITPPFRTRWRHRATALLEFPPVIARHALFQLADDGVMYSLRKETGHVRWQRRLGSLAASSPALAGRTAYVTLLERRRGSGRGRVVAVRQRDGHIVWSRDLRSRSESSPLVADGRVFLGSEDGTVYALDAGTGRLAWTYHAGGAVKGSPSLSQGILYFGDYSGQVHAVRARDGHRIWTSPVAQRALRGGRFYATAALAFGRVYIGATDGREYSLSARDGRLAWARQTGAYVYSSAAVHEVTGLGPAVFVGSYDGSLYAFGARTGRTLWTHHSGGKISGSPTIVGGTLYFSDLGRHSTTGLRTRDGKVVFRDAEVGAFDPVVSDGRWIFLTGRTSVTALEPRARRIGGRGRG